MRFKHKDGTMFNSVLSIWYDKCAAGGWDCGECPIGTEALSINACCRRFVMDYPVKAARLMGYGVVEEKCDTCANENPSVECVNCGSKYWNYRPKEQEEPMKQEECTITSTNGETIVEKVDSDNSEEVFPPSVFSSVDKPFSEWTLGEVQEYCCHTGCDRCRFQVRTSGAVCDLNGSPNLWNLTDLPRFTEKEVADARAIIDLFHSTWHKIKRNKNGSLALIDVNNLAVALLDDKFPSILPGQSVKLSEIVGGAS